VQRECFFYPADWLGSIPQYSQTLKFAWRIYHQDPKSPNGKWGKDQQKWNCGKIVFRRNMEENKLAFNQTKKLSFGNSLLLFRRL
jgi:hypothetical protein